MPIYDIFEHVERQKEAGNAKPELSTHISDMTLGEKTHHQKKRDIYLLL